MVADYEGWQGSVMYQLLQQHEYLVSEFLALETPEGLRAQLIDGEILVTPPPDGSHEEILSTTVTQTVKRSAVDHDFSGHKGLRIAMSSGHEHFAIPDGTWVSSTVGFAGAAPWMAVPAAAVTMVAEVTGYRRSDVDREAKRRCYAAGKIPLYLLIDRDHRTVVLFSAPEDGDYVQALSFPFGRPVPLPEPFSFDLDTSRFT